MFPPAAPQETSIFVTIPLKIFLDFLVLFFTMVEYEGIAQMVERLNGIQEVGGSIPLISTKILYI